MAAVRDIVVDGDGHVAEPFDMWKDYIDPKYRERAPRISLQDNGLERVAIDTWYLEPKAVPFSAGSSLIPGSEAIADTGRRMKVRYAEGQPGAFDPHPRVKDMDLCGIDAAVLYPTIGLMFGFTEDADLAAALCRAYNDWLADYCKPYPARLFGIGLVPIQDPAEAAVEARRAVEKLGHRGVMLRPNRYLGRRWDDRAYDPFWAVVQDLGVPVAFHEGLNGAMPTVGLERCKDFFFGHIISHPHEQQFACMEVLCGGVLERFPRLRIGFLESGGGWLPHWLERLDSHWKKLGYMVSDVRQPPSEYFRRQCFVSFDPDEKTLPMTAELVSSDSIIWASDYPHWDAEFPGCVEELREQSLPSDVLRKVLGQNAVRIYGLPLDATVQQPGQ